MQASSERRDTPAEVIAEELERWLGPHTARTAIRTFAKHVLGMTAEQVGPADVPRLLKALRPMLNTLLGQGLAQSILDALTGRFAP